MINQKYIVNETIENDIFPFFDEKIDRLRSTLQGRLNLINACKSAASKDHIPITLINLGINSNCELEILRYLEESNYYIESTLCGLMDEWFLKNGTQWQRNRVLELKKIGV
jgi:hypothetical protein